MVELGNHWDTLLQEEFHKEYYLRLRHFLKQEYANRKVYPKMEDIFNAVKTTDYPDVSVVILGQDPYHGTNQAHGFAFSVQPGVLVPPSLQNIYQELHDDIGCFIPNNGYLLSWAQQGVLLLNTVLTVRAGQANSHKGMGWECFTDKIISLLNDRQEPVVFLLWGNNALSKQPLITNPQHTILRAPHPSPFSASRGFFGCRHFSKTNDILVKSGRRPIDWQIQNR